MYRIPVEVSSSSVEASMTAVRHLSPSVRKMFQKLVEDGTIRQGDFDSRAIAGIQALTEPLQQKVLQHIERDRIVYVNSRSKQGYILGACEKAKRGELDVRGYGSVDPWDKQLASVCSRPDRILKLIPELKYAEQFPDSVSLTILELAQDGTDALVNSFNVDVYLNSTIGAFKDYLHDARATLMPRNQIKIRHSDLGWLKDERTFAYYNIKPGSSLLLSRKFRGGRRVNKPE